MALVTGHYVPVQKGVPGTWTIQDCLKELQTVRQALQQVEITNGKVLSQIEARARNRSVLDDSSQKMAELEAKTKIIGCKMNVRDQRLAELGTSVNSLSDRVDDILKGILTMKKSPSTNTKAVEIDLDGEAARRAVDSTVDSKGVKQNLTRPVINERQAGTKETVKLETRNSVNNGKAKRDSKPQLDLPPIRCISRLKSRVTDATVDNRLKVDKMEEHKRLERKRQIANIGRPETSPLLDANIQNKTVLLKKQDARFEEEFKSMPAIGHEVRDGLVAALVWQQWHTYAEKEKNRGAEHHLVRYDRGLDVVLCLDTSQSMDGPPFEEMMTFAMKYVEGVESQSIDEYKTENISVTTFGYVTKVWIHLTNDYSAVKATLREIRELIPRGQSPIGAGLLVALAGCLGNGRDIVVSGILIRARIILISDGKGTPDHVKTGPELMSEHAEVMMSRLIVDANLSDVANNLKKRKNTIYCVPVGNANTRTLEALAKITGGRLFDARQRDKLIKWTGLTVQGVIMCRASADITPGKSREDSEPMLQLFLDSRFLGLLDEDKEDVMSIAATLAEQVTDVPPENMTTEHDADLPPLGTRVRRGPGWHYPDHQDSKRPGTVCSHDRAGMVWVEWDNGHRNCYNYKHGGNEVVIVLERRVLKSDELIATGCYVKRGDDWTHGEDDGGPGSIGVVTRVRQDGTVIVRWTNKQIKEYKFGSEGVFELQICTDEHQESHSSTTDPERHVAPQGEGLRIESFLPPVQY